MIRAPAPEERISASRFDAARYSASETVAMNIHDGQLYGIGLKKGIVYDLLNTYRVEHIRPDGRFQYYDLRRLWADTQIALRAGLSALNVATPAVTNARVAAECFGLDIADQEVAGEESPFAQMYTRDMRTVHAELFGGPPGYLMDEASELSALQSFVQEARLERAVVYPSV